MKISFNVPVITGKEARYVLQAIGTNKLSGNGEFTSKCHQWFYDNIQCSKILLTTSCTHALEMCAMLANIKDGDEIIMPSYTFVSSANAFVLRGAKIIFIDIRPDTMNMDERLIENAITDRTRAIVPVHYAGVACEMEAIMNIAQKYNLLVVEDAAQGVGSEYNGKALGTIGHLGCYSFHETKNYNCGEGGALIINDEQFVKRAEVIWEKGTNRSGFLRGEVEKYTWIDIGSSYLPSELNAAYLYGQLEHADEIKCDRLRSWELYYEGLKPLADQNYIELPYVPIECTHNASLFFIKVKDFWERTRLIKYFQDYEILTSFHYLPLHISAAGKISGQFYGEDKWTTKESERLLRLPLYYKLDRDKIEYVIRLLRRFYGA